MAIASPGWFTTVMECGYDTAGSSCSFVVVVVVKSLLPLLLSHFAAIATSLAGCF